MDELLATIDSLKSQHFLQPHYEPNKLIESTKGLKIDSEVLKIKGGKIEEDLRFILTALNNPK